MKDEIKEKIPFNVRDVLEDINSNILWNYITNLQKELTIMVRDDERSQETIIRLTKENERLKENNQNMQEEMSRCWQRIDKVVEKINREYYIKEHEWNDRIINEVLDILQNEIKEED